jgi:hypothetical protein
LASENATSIHRPLRMAQRIKHGELAGFPQPQG